MEVLRAILAHATRKFEVVFMITKRLENWFLRKKHLASMICLVLFVLSSTAISLMSPSLNSIRLILGIFGYVWLPGALLASLVGLFESRNLGLSLVLGFLFQLINVYVAWILSRLFGVIDFYSVITVLTLLLIVILSFLLSNHAHVLKKETVSLGLISFKNVDRYLALSLVLYLALVAYFQGFAVQPTSDGASYLDMARNVVEKGIFRSNMLAKSNDWNSVVFSTGGISHMFGYFAFSFFFTFFGVSVLSAKIGLIFGGFLIIIITFLLTEELLGKNTARLASFIVATSAVFLTDIGLVGGPEIISVLFTLLTLYLVLIGMKSNKKALWFLAGLSSFVAWYAWYINFYALLGVLICSAAYFAPFKKESIKTNLLFNLLLFACLIVDDRITSNFTLEKIGFPIPLLSIVMIPLIYLVSTRKNLELPQLSLIIVSTLVILNSTYLLILLASPESMAFQTKLLEVGITNANIGSNLGTLSRAFRIESIIFYWNVFKDGIYKYIGQATILLVLISFIRPKKIKKTLFLAMFPLFIVLIWGLLVVIDRFQPRFVIGFSIFCDILAASAIVFISKSATSRIKFNRIAELIVMRKQLRIDVKKLIGFLVAMLLFVSYFGLTFETYNNGKNIEQSWNLRQEFGWDNAIDWIQSNTSSKDTLACVHGDYFSWYADRQTVFLWSIPDKNESVLIDLIRTLRVNYLIVDIPFKSKFADLSELYESPTSFLGSTIAFMSKNEAGEKVVVYNVTNIAYGNLATYEFEPNWQISENWAPLLWYCTGNISANQDSVRIDCTPIERSPTSAAATFNFAPSANLSKYSSMEFWMKVPKSSEIYLEIYSGNHGQNYYSYSIPNSVYDEWTEISVGLDNNTNVQGDPSLQTASKLDFIVAGVSAGEITTFWIKDLSFSGQEYVLQNATA